jgi:hypothetical protein
LKLAPEPLLPERPYVDQVVELLLSGAALAGLMSSVLERGASLRFCARGTSMAPLIQDGDLIQVVPLQGKSLRLGDVAAFIQPASGKLVVHRLVNRRGQEAWFSGDNMRGALEGPLALENVLGRVAAVERAGRAVALGLGPERRLVALLSRSGLLLPLIRSLAPFYRLVVKGRPLR